MDEKKMSLKDEMESKILQTVRINNVPLSFWEEFKKDAELNFANNYIMKIMVDHCRRVQGDARLDELLLRVEELEKALSDIGVGIKVKDEPAIENKTERKVKTFGVRSD